MANLFEEHHRDFIQILDKKNVEYIIIGGVVVNIYGYNRGTGDIDIWVNSTNSNKENLISAIEEFGYDAEHLKSIAITEIIMFSLGSRQETGHIEITNKIDGIKFDEAYKRIQIKEIEGIKIKYLHYEDLIINKLTSGRPRDMDDIENLKRIHKNINPNNL